MGGPISVLLAEDEESFVDALVIGLRHDGFDLSVARDGQEAIEMFEAGTFDLVLLDLMLPKMSGIDVCRAIRRHSNVPIIIVTAKASEIDTVVGLEVGADDYVAKPYRLRELVARMHAVLRRSAALEAGPEKSATRTAPGSEGVVEVATVRIDIDQRRVFVRDEEIQLRRKEFDLLLLLAENPSRVLTRDVLIDRIWGSDYVGDTKTLDVHIKRLRAQIEEDPSSPRLITTVRGVGYRFDAGTKR
jgi:two-component system response regulator RegX3